MMSREKNISADIFDGYKLVSARNRNVCNSKMVLFQGELCQLFLNDYKIVDNI